MAIKPRPDKPFSVRIPPDLLAMLRKKAEMSGTTVGKTIVQILKEHSSCDDRLQQEIFTRLIVEVVAQKHLEKIQEQIEQVETQLDEKQKETLEILKRAIHDSVKSGVKIGQTVGLKNLKSDQKRELAKLAGKLGHRLQKAEKGGNS